MRKPRDFDAELKALEDKAQQLKERKLAQLGELVLATGADALPVELLAGALLSAADATDLVTKEEWRRRGETFFQGARKASAAVRNNSRRAAPAASSTPATAGADRA